MRTVHRALSTAVAVGALFPFGLAAAPAASADVTPIKVETAGWFWSQQVSGEAAPGVTYPGTVPQSASGVPAGDLAVAYAGKTENRPDGTKESIPDKETYLAWDVYVVPEGSTVNSFTFSMVVDPEGKNLELPPANPQVAPPRGGVPPIVACAALSGFGAGEGDSFASKPKDDCTDQVYGVYDATKQTYTFDATVYAQDWVDGKDNFGLAIRPLDDEDDPFQVVFKGAATVVTTLDFTPPEEEVVEEDEEPLPVDTGIAEPPVTDNGTGFVPAPQPEPQAPPAPKPTVAPTRRAPATNVAARPVSVDAGIGAEFWLAMLAGVLVLGIVSLILGDPLVPAIAGREDALTRALRQRRTAGAVPGARPLPGQVRTHTS